MLLACALLLAPAAPAKAGAAAGILIADDFDAETAWEWQAPAPGNQSARAPMSAGSGGAIRLAVVLANFSDQTSEPFDAAAVSATVFSSPDSVAALFAEQSGGQVTLSGTIFGWITLPSSAATCDYVSWAEGAEAALGPETLAGYTNLVVLTPKTEACTWAGLAYLGGSTAWINGEPTLTAFAHELGHNLGLGHASALACTQGDERVVLSESCIVAGEYGDPFTTMGSGASAHLTGVHKAQLGWLAPDGIQTVTAGGTFTLTPLAAPGFGVRALRIPWGDEHLHLEFRQPLGSFEQFWPGAVLGGVLTRLADERALPWRSGLLDATPATPAYLDATLLPG